jgi:hypothetical protein
MPGSVARLERSSRARHDGCSDACQMHSMPATVDAADVALRLGLTVLAGMLIGCNRREHGKAAGLRTTMLVSAWRRPCP